MPLAGAESVTVSVSVCPKFASAITIDANGKLVPGTLTTCPDTPPFIVGGTEPLSTIMVVVVSDALIPIVSCTSMLTAVVTV